MKTKILITLALVLALLFAPFQQSRASVAGGVCLIIVAAAAVGGVAIVVRSCQPKYFCLMDPNEQPPKYWVGRCSRQELVANGWIALSGPYASVQEGEAHCPPPANTNLKLSNLGTREMPVKIYLEQSTNLVDWVEIASVIDDPTNFSFSFTNAPSETAFYYRARTVAP